MAASDLETLDKETLSAPDSRVKSVASVRSRISEIQQGDRTRAGRRTKLQGLIDGNQPYLPDAMRKAGRGEDANINFREAEGMIAAATTPYYDLVFEIPRAVNIELYFGENKIKNQEWGNIFAEKYTRMLWNWKGYDIQTQLSQWQMVVHGVGLIIWDKPRGWHFEAKKAGTFLVADNAPCDLSKLEEAINLNYFTPTQLFRMIDKKRIDKAWNVKKAKWAIINALPQDDKDRMNLSDQWEAYQASLRRGDVQWSNKALRIYYTDYFIKEYDGKITHCIVLDQNPDQNDNQAITDSEDDFLFKKTGRFESFDQIITPYFYDVGPDGNWYSVKGLGPKIYDFCDLSNKYRCTLLNGALASCGPAIQAGNAQAYQKAQQTPIVRSNGVTMFSPDWNMLPNQFQFRADGLMAVLRELQGTAQSNTGQYRQRVAEEFQEPTLGQAELNAQQQSTLSKGAFNRFYRQDDMKHENLIRRVLDPSLTEDDPGGKEAKEMIDDCVECGVPREALTWENITSVKAVRNMGYGSPQMQQIIGRQLKELIPAMSPEGANHAFRTVLAPWVGQSEVGAFFPSIEDAGIPTDQEWAATMENLALRSVDTVVPPVVSEQNPEIHFTVHFKDVMTHLQQLKAGQANPVEVLVHLEQAGPHMHEHLEQMNGDPMRKSQYEQFQKMWLSLAKMADELKKQIQKAQAQQQPAQAQPDPEMMKDLMKLQGELELKNKALDAKIDRDERKFQSQSRLKDLMTADKMYRAAAENAAKAMPIRNGQEAPV